RFHQVDRFVVEKRAVLDGVDARTDRAFGALGAVRMRGGLLPQRVRFIDDGVQLLLRELRHVWRVGQRQDAAGRAYLDDVGTVLDVVADGAAPFLRAVDDALLDA